MQYEAEEQKTVVEYCRRKNIPVFHIPNGGKRNLKEAVHLKAQGVTAGVPDLCIPVPAGKYHGLYIEMKYGKNGLTDNQMKWCGLLLDNGYAVKVCYGANLAIKAIEKYLKGEQP